MALSPVKFLFGFLLLSIILWLLFMFASRLLSWILSRTVGVSLGFRVGGWKCLRDIVLKFNKGAIESVSVGEIRLSLRRSLVKLGVGFFSRDPKLQLLICDLEIVMRPTYKSSQKAKTHKQRSSGRSSGRGKWMVVANMARFLSVSLTDLVVKTPKSTIEVKELSVDISKVGGSKPDLFVKLKILPIIVHVGEPRGCDQLSNFNNGEFMSSGQASIGMMERTPSLFRCEELVLSCEFGHNSEVGILIKSVDITSGEVAIKLNEELFAKKGSSLGTSSTDKNVGSIDSVASKKSREKQAALATLTKFTSNFPEKVCINLPKLDVSFIHQEHNLVINNNIMGVQLRTAKSPSSEDVGESTRLDFQLEFSEIHLFREAGTSILEILKVDVVSLFYIPIEATSPVRAEIDVKLGGTRCNIIMSRLKPWLKLQLSKKKAMTLREEKPTPERHPSTDDMKIIMWTCTLSAPEMTVVLYSISGSPVYHGCSQSSHVFANNISSMGTLVHMELGELNLHLAEEYHECSKENLFGMESNSGSLLHIAKVSLDWGKKDMDTVEDDSKCKLVLSVDVTGMGVYFTFKRVESLVSTIISFQTLLKNLSGSGKRMSPNRGDRSSKSSGKGTRLLKFNLERCSVNFAGDSGLENTTVADPKRVNYGSQGGQVVISVSADGTPRTAKVISTVPDGRQKMKYSVSLDIFHFSMCVNKEKHTTQIEVERGRSIYQEFLEEQRSETKVTLVDIQNAKFVRRSGGLKEIAVCSLFSATDITLRWEPDVHLSLIELVLQLKSLIYNQKLQEAGNKDVSSGRDVGHKNEVTPELGHVDKNKKKETIFAVDVEMLSISAEAGDGVEVMIQVQSIFSENARIGVLLEGLTLILNGSRIFKSSRMQISRIPSTSAGSSDGKASLGTVWDWVIQGLDIHICMPFRLELRAIDDAFEDMLRGLKLIIAAKTQLLCPMKKESSKTKKPSSMKLGCLKFYIHKLSAEIEEEPLQGWLDEHYRLMKNEASELAVRMKFLDELISEGNKSSKAAESQDSIPDKKICYNGAEINLEDPSSVLKVQEAIHKESFKAYYQACQNLVKSEGSGACKEGFQAGFKLSTTRTSVFSICATDLDVSLTKIDGGDKGMIEFLKKLDPVIEENDIPFSRLYGRNMSLRIGSVAVNLRDYTNPLFHATSARCKGCLVLAQQATCFQPQIYQDVFIGKWRKVCMLRSAPGTTPPMKTYTDLPIYFQKADVSYGVGYEPVLADVSYAFTVALRRAHLSVRNPIPPPQPPKKEKSLPWWDDMRNYIHGKITLFFTESRFHILATTDPYEKLDKLQVTSAHMEIQQSDGRVFVSAKEFKFFPSSLESLINRRSTKVLDNIISAPFLVAPSFTLEVIMEWDCASGKPLNHYLFALPVEEKSREIVFEPFRSTSLSLRWNFSLRSSLPSGERETLSSSMGASTDPGESVCGPHRSENVLTLLPTMTCGPHDLAWIVKFISLNHVPPHKLRMFSRWPRFGVPRIPRSGNLSLDRVMTEFMLRVDSTPAVIKHLPLDDDDPAKGLTISMTKLKYEYCSSRGAQKYTFDSTRDPLDLIYQGFDLHLPKVFLRREGCTSVAKMVQRTKKGSESSSVDRVPGQKANSSACTEKHHDDGFLLSSDYFTIRKQAPKADPARLLAWQEAGRRNVEMTYVRSEFENGSESDEHTRLDPSDDDGYNVVIADNCQRVFVYGLKLLWTIENRDAVWSWVGGISRALSAPKPSPSRQYAQRKLLEEKQRGEAGKEKPQDNNSNPSASNPGASSPAKNESSESTSTPSLSANMENSSSPTVVKGGDDPEEEGTCHFMVNVIEPQFNLHSEEANGRFLLAAVSGRVLARSFHSVVQVGHEMIEHALGPENVRIREIQPEMTWKRMEFSVMLEHVQAHVAPTDVDPGAGLQWLPKIQRRSPKVKRTGALLERVFTPCDMYFRYTRHKGGTPDLKMKPLKELTFNSHAITAAMTSRQYHVMVDVLKNLLFGRLPKPRKSSLSFIAEDDDDVEEEADEVVPDGVEEVELAKVNLEHKEREKNLVLADIRKLSRGCDASGETNLEKDGDFWMATGGRSVLVQGLRRELVNAQRSRKEAYASFRMALEKAAQIRLMEKENKSPSFAMRISMQINKVVWNMLVDGKSFAEAEINEMVFDFDRDYKDIGVAVLTTKYFVLRNCQPNAKSDMVLSAWNPPPEWGKKVMLRVDAKQGLPRNGNTVFELFQVEIYPLKIHMMETTYKVIWDYIFPYEEQDSQRRQEAWKVSTTAGAKRVRKGSMIQEAPASNSRSSKDSEGSSKCGASVVPAITNQPSTSTDSSHVPKLQNTKTKTASGSNPELRRTSSFDRSWEETVAESVANELVLQVHSSGISSPKAAPVNGITQLDESSKTKSKDPKAVKAGRTSHEEKKVGKVQEEKRTRPQKAMEFHNIKISQVELLLTYEGSIWVMTDIKLLIDTFHRAEFTGSWMRLASRVKKHFVWGVLKSLTGMQGKKFKDKLRGGHQREPSSSGVPDTDLILSDNEGQGGKSEQYPLSWPKRPGDGAGDRFVTSIRGLFNTQRRKAKAFVLRTMRGEAENDFQGEWSESDVEFSPFARQLTITKAKKLIKRHTKKFRSRKGSSSQQVELLPLSPTESTPFESDSSSGTSPYEDFHE